ncbi:MAG TPA: ABC transporter substrate-binding protein [Bradyrhizobium sp.]|nr:ABC transporter substrate-binding protein [Bradyrhizobium sp.]
MAELSRRSVLCRSLGLAAAAGLMRPYIANAAATTATLWWTQGFAQEEDTAITKIFERYQKESGNTLDFTIMPYAPLRQKIVSAITTGTVPDLFQNNPAEIVALYAWDDKLVDVTDVIDTQRQEYTESALLSAHCYNKVTRNRSFYGVPYNQAGLLNHIWRPLVEKAGRRIDEIPNTWDARYDFFKGLQKPLRALGMRKIYGVGFTLSSTGNDTNNQFNSALITYGGQDIVTKDGRLHLDDPKVRAAVIKTLTYPTTAYKDGFVPPSAINWNDSDNNNAFHSKQIVMDIDGTISTEVAIIDNRQDYDDILTMGLPLNNDGKPVPSQVNNACGLIPKGAKNVQVAKDFLKYLIQPKICGEYLKAGLGRNIPAMPSIVKNDSWWFEDPHRAVYVNSSLIGPTAPAFWVYNPGYARVQNEHVWGRAWGDIITAGITPKAAAVKAYNRITEIFAQYEISQS